MEQQLLWKDCAVLMKATFGFCTSFHQLIVARKFLTQNVNFLIFLLWSAMYYTDRNRLSGHSLKYQYNSYSRIFTLLFRLPNVSSQNDSRFETHLNHSLAYSINFKLLVFALHALQILEIAIPILQFPSCLICCLNLAFLSIPFH